jgi:twinkle protein
MARKIEGRRFIIGDSIAEILAEAGIDRRVGARILGLAPDRDEKAICPACGGGRTREISLSVRVDPDGQGVAWNCKRGTCTGNAVVPGAGRIERSGIAEDGDVQPLHQPRSHPVRPTLPSPGEQICTPPLLAWFSRRGISEQTVSAFRIYEGWHWFPQIGTEAQAVIFPYVWKGEVVNRKFRNTEKHFVQDKGALRTLFNADAIDSDGEVVFVEGEMDVLACWEVGLRHVVSLPDGAPAALRDENDPARQADRRFEALVTCGDVIARMRKIVIATDADVPGGYLAEELVRRLGRARCWRVRWPEGCKDANDVLVQLGPEALRDAIAAAEPWPLAGLATLRPGSLVEFRRRDLAPRGLESGIADMDAVARLPAGGGWLTVLTGVPSHGKSTLLRAWLVYLAARHRLGVIYASPEDNRAENLALNLAAIWRGAPWREGQRERAMTDDELGAAEAWIQEHFSFIQSDNPDTEMTLDWVLARAEEAKMRAERHLLVLDPWNEFEHQFGRGETETQYVGRSLRRLKAWGRAEGIGVIIAAHPKQLVIDPKKRRYPVADGYDISGSANWFNRADLGLTAYRREEGFLEAHCWKARFRPFGMRHHHARLQLDEATGRLRSSGVLGGDARPEAAGDTEAAW